MARTSKEIITSAANRYGIDPDLATRIAHIETGGTFDPRAFNRGSKASGLFQFIPSTWSQYGGGASPFDPEANADAAMRLLLANKKVLTNRLGREPTGGEIYMAHQQGAGGASAILRRGDELAYKLVGQRAVESNLPSARRGEAMTMTGKQFSDLWTQKLNAVGGTPLVKGGTITGSLDASGDFRSHDGIDPTRTQVTMGEIDTTRQDDQFTARKKQIEEDEKRAKEAPSLWEGTKLAVQNEWSLLAPFRFLGNMPDNPDYTFDAKEMTRVGEGIPTEYLSQFEGVVSAQHADAIRSRLMNQLENNRQLSMMGGTGIALNIAAAMTDPAAWAAMAGISVVTGGLGAPAALAARFGRVGTAALSATEGALANSLVDIPLIATNPTKDWSDLKYSIGTGIVMGGIFNQYRHANRVLSAENDLIEDMARNLHKDPVSQADSLGSSAGAKQVGYVEPTLRSDAREEHRAWKEFDKTYKVAFGQARVDLAAQLGKSGNPMVRGIGKHFVEDATGNAMKGEVTAISATERKRRMQRVANSSWALTFNEQGKAYLKNNNVPWTKTEQELSKFSDMITDYVRADDLAKAAFPKEVQAAGEQWNKVMQNWWKQAGEAGLTRSEVGVRNYVPRVVHRGNSVDLITKFGMGKGLDGQQTGASKLFSEAVKAKQPNIKPELADKMGFAIADRMYKLGHGHEYTASRAMSGEDMDELRQFLRDAKANDGHLSDAEIDEIMDAVNPKRTATDKDAGGSSRLKQRVIMDENFEMKLTDKHGQQHSVKVSDFYVRDSNLLMQMYNNQMSGQLALADIKIPHPYSDTGELLVDGFRKAGDFDTFIEKVRAVGAEEVKLGNTKINTDRDIENLKFAYNAVAGVPNYSETGNLYRFLRLLRDFNFGRLMGQVGFSQIPEASRAVVQMGFKTSYHALPAFRDLMSTIRTGKLTDALGAEIDDLVAIGRDFEIAKKLVHTDDFGVPQHLSSGGGSQFGKAMDWAEPKMHRINQAVALGSGMVPINNLLQKWAARAFSQKMFQAAGGGKALSTERLRLLGLSDGQVNGIYDAIRKHGKSENGTLKELGIGSWPTSVRGDYEDALYRGIKGMIMENDAGQFAKWMHTPVGKVLLQFRSFAVGAYTRGLLQGINMRDFPAAMQLLTGSITGSLVYAGQSHLQLLGDPDRETKLAQRMELGNLAMAGFMRSSESSLVPMMIDTGAMFTAGKPILDYRSSGLTGLWAGNPTGDLFNTAWKGTSGIITALFGDEYSRPDARAAFEMLPMQRLLPLQWMFNFLTAELPRRDMP